MNPEMFRKCNVLFIIDNCSKCRILCEFIERINLKLPIEERIKIVNCTYYQNYKIIDNPLLLIFNKHFDGFPTLFFKGIKIAGSNSRIESETYLNALLQDKYVIKEYDERKFEKECEFKRRGIIKGVICK